MSSEKPGPYLSMAEAKKVLIPRRLENLPRRHEPITGLTNRKEADAEAFALINKSLQKHAEEGQTIVLKLPGQSVVVDQGKNALFRISSLDVLNVATNIAPPALRIPISFLGKIETSILCDDALKPRAYVKISADDKTLIFPFTTSEDNFPIFYSYNSTDNKLTLIAAANPYKPGILVEI